MSAVRAAPDTRPAQDIEAVAPQLQAYTQNLLFEDVWRRPELSPRDRSLITMSALVAGGHTAQMPGHLNRALDNGVKPIEITALITHLAFYSGWPSAMSAISVAKEVFKARGIGPEQLHPASDPLPVDAANEAKRRAAIEQTVNPVAPDLARYTNDVLFGDLWRQTDLTARDRSLVTVAALIAEGQTDQLAFHLNRAMDNGLTQAQAAEVITHLAFYVGWPRATSAVTVARTVLDARGH
jgi:4-carboxymuconolactone decarboxylase